MNPKPSLLTDYWVAMDGRWQRAFGLRLDEYQRRLRNDDAARTEVLAPSPSEYVAAWREHLGADRADHLITLVKCCPTADLPHGVVLTSPPLATQRYVTDSLDEHCPAFEVQVTVTLGSAVDMPATLATLRPEQAALDVLVAEEGVAITLLPDRLVLREASPLALPTDPLPSAEELLRVAAPHFERLDDSMIAGALASLMELRASDARLRGRMRTYVAYDLGRGLSFREARRGGDSPSLLSLALAALESQGAVPREHRPPGLVGAFVAQRTRRGRPPGATEHRSLAADGTFVADGALAEFTRWGSVHGERELWLYRPDGTRRIVRRAGYRPADRRVKLDFDWRVGEWLELWTRAGQ